MSTTPSEPTDRWVRRLLEKDAGESEALERAWDALELPPAAAVPPGFSARVAAGVRPDSAPDSGLEHWRAFGPSGNRGGSRLPGWAAAAALLLGIAMGGAVAYELQGTSEPADDVATLAESYLAAASVEELAGTGADLDVGIDATVKGEEEPR